MSRARHRVLPVFRVLVLLGVGAVWAIACGGPQPLGGAGSVCFRADECQAGLACVPETMGATKHVCSADLSGIVSMVDGAPTEAGEMPEATGGSAPTPEGGGGPSVGGMTVGSGGKPTAGGTTGSGGKSGTAGSPATAGTSAGGRAAGGSSSSNGGSEAGGSSPGGSSNGGENSSSGGTAG
ncbi:MAG TPA: hypothetical protein VER96_33265 [Polyangiaceae bacterium]|nr:hypothetical protein [Polyangiaceae bacterium]